MGRKRVGDDIWSGGIIELYQLVVCEILNIASQLVTFFQGVPLGPKMVFALLRRIKSWWKGTFSGPLKQWGH